MVKKSSVAIFFYFLFLFIFFEFYGLDALEGYIDFQFYADTPTYHSVYKMNYDLNSLIALNPNLFGPLLVLRLLEGNYHLVFFLNLLIFYIAFINIRKHYNLDSLKYLIFLILCPLMIGSLMGVNKEIFSLFVCSYLLVYLKTKLPKHLIFAILFCFFVRWQLFIFVLIVALYYSDFNPLKNKPLKTLAILVVAISIVYPLLFSGNEILSHVNDVAQLAGENETDGSGIYTQLIQIQNKPFGFIIAVIPKALQLLGGLLFRWRNIFETSNLYNNFFMFLQSLAYMIMLVKILKKKCSLNNELIFIGVIYLAIFSISPIYTPRYLFPVYILMSIELSKRDKKSQSKKIVQSRP